MRTAAALCSGLKPDSRTKMRLLGLTVPYNTYLLAGILDGINWLVWSKTENGQKNANKPKSILQELTKDEQTELQTFKTGEEFMKAREKLLGGKDGN